MNNPEDVIAETCHEALLQDVCKALRAELVTLRKDAERYRWLREHINGERWNMLFDDCGRNPLDRVELDRAVDAEMSIAPAVEDEQKKTMEHKTILVQRFRSPDGAPTCCADHPAGQTCRFLGVRSFGTVDVCMLGEQRDLAPRTADFQRPDVRCEVWVDAQRCTIADFEARARKRAGTFVLAAPKDPGCWCARCDMEHNVMRTRMSVCDKCGDKRCPRAEDHRDECRETPNV